MGITYNDGSVRGLGGLSVKSVYRSGELDILQFHF